MATAIQTVPTGFSGVPPVGPAMPEVATAQSEFIDFIAPLAISMTTSSQTAPFFSRVSGFTPNKFTFISSEYANSNVDMPALPADAYSVTADKERFAVVDVGGDDRGALALGRYVPEILSENDYEMLFVINKFRPLTRTAELTAEVMREIEEAAKLKFTGIVNNSNVGDETTAEDILSSVGYAKEVSRKTGLPIKMTSIHYDLQKELEGKIENLFPIKLYIRQTWKAE